jgi:hypothetical protein
VALSVVGSAAGEGKQMSDMLQLVVEIINTRPQQNRTHNQTPEVEC